MTMDPRGGAMPGEGEGEGGEPRPEEIRRIGRGAIYLSFTKLYFIVASFGIYFGFRFVARTPEEGVRIFGDYKTVTSAVSILGTVLVAGTIQAVSRFAARARSDVRSLLRTALRVEIAAGLLIGGGFFLAAEPLTGGDPRLLPAMRVAALIPLIYPVYASFVGVVNGQRRFAAQAAIDAAFTTLKAAFILAAVFWFGSAAAAYGGFALCALLIAVASYLVMRRGLPAAGEGGAPVSAARLAGFQIQTATFMFLVQWIVHTDLLYIQMMSGAGDVLLKDARALYGGMQLYAQLSYSVVIALALVLFPLVSRVDAERDLPGAAAVVRETLRYASILVAGAVGLFSLEPRIPLSLLFGLEETGRLLSLFPDRMAAFTVLGAGFACLSAGFLACSAMNAAGRVRLSILAVGSGAALHLLLALVLIPRLDLLGAACAAASGMFLFAGLALGFARSVFGPCLPVPTILKALLSAGAVLAASRLLPPAGLAGGVLRIFAGGAAYLGILILMREFTRRDSDRILALFGTRSHGRSP